MMCTIYGTRLTINFCAACLVLLLIAGSSLGQISDAKQEVLKEYLIALSAIESQYSNVRGSGDFVIKNLKKGDEEKRHLSFAINGKLRKVSEQRPGTIGDKVGRTVEGVTCIGLNDGFRIERELDGTGPVIRTVRSQDLSSLESTMAAVFLTYVAAPYSVFGIPVRTLMDRPGFTVTSVDTLEKGGKKLLKIHFEFDPKKPQMNLKSGWFVVSPSENWVLYEYECAFGKKGTGRATGSVQYRDRNPGSGSPPLPKVVVEATGSSRKSWEFDSIEYVTIPESEFTLSYYSLPEYHRPGSSRGRWQWLLLFNGVGVLLVVAAICLRRMARRRVGDHGQQSQSTGNQAT